ncbi:hypothetical protein [Dyadobacter fermentans]|uniref:hypothetical protein n=1 Tax=Dyadobacter fermentans TaxID=94254 RepID=UPI001CBACBF4|nr:hypothetical protein [Dyadobacter fermentans]MBZ1362043.1 hypothetical protein [Dyadobacter fermentans]
MSNIQEIIKSHFENLYGVTVLYEYSSLYELHLLKLIPYNSILKDEVFKAIRAVIRECTRNNPDESWYLVEDDDMIKMTCPTFLYWKEEKVVSNHVYVDASYNGRYLPTPGVLIATDNFKNLMSPRKLAKTIDVIEKATLENYEYAFAA